MTGIIKVLKTGFGFIKQDGEDNKKDLFFHAKNLQGGLRFDNLHEGDRVSFDVEESPKGPNAINVTLVEEDMA